MRDFVLLTFSVLGRRMAWLTMFAMTVLKVSFGEPETKIGDASELWY